MKSRRSWWLIYGVCAAGIVATLGWITVVVIRLERAEIHARTEAAYQEALRLALWRMDSWLAPLLAREAARPYFDYQAFYPQQRAYTALLRPIGPGEVLTPSPLLSYDSELFSIHFQISPAGVLTSPQAPSGSFRDLAEGAFLSGEAITTNTARLSTVSNLVTRDEVAQCVAAADVQPPVPLLGDPAGGVHLAGAQSDDTQQQQLRTQQELSRRKGAYYQAVAVVDRNGASIEVGSLVPFWSDGPDKAELIFTRAVRVADKEYFQGFLCDWPTLRSNLLEQIEDLFSSAALVPVRGATAQAETTGTMLATIPVALEAARPAPIAAGMFSPARSTLALTWLAFLTGMIAVAVTLRASIAFGQRRSRFASAVTHELRTPLTTFRMYSEMLADGMVKDKEQRQAYLDTLKAESGRLSTLVENVLAYARLEEGRAPRRPAATTLDRLLADVEPQLRQRAEGAGMKLVVDNVPDDVPLMVDTEAVGQILFNLVDNSCKYCTEADDQTIHVTTSTSDGSATMCVRDHGPGVPESHAASIFAPFERGDRNLGDSTPGVGLGLALARELARNLGGDLKLSCPPDGGAAFELTLPR